MACEIHPSPVYLNLGANQTLNVTCTNNGVTVPCYPNTNWSVFPAVLATLNPGIGITTNITGTSTGHGVVYTRDPSMDPAYQCYANLSVILVIVPLQPDYVGSISFDNPAPIIGSTVHVNITTRNAGAGTSAASYTNFSIDGSLARRYHVPGLALGASQSDTYDYLCTAGGRHKFDAYVDADDDVSEASEGNNLASNFIVCYSAQALACYDYI